MKILMVAVFSPKSTNNSQALCFEKNGATVVRFNYRKVAGRIGAKARDDEIIRICRDENVDLVFFSKCNGVHARVLDECNKTAKTCLWYMDPLNNFNGELIEKIKRVTFSCYNITSSFRKAQTLVNNAFQLVEGFDPFSNFYMSDVPFLYDVTFIGNPRGHRSKYIQAVDGVKVISDAYGSKHSEAVCSSRINLNFTHGGSSDRTYKVLASKGFYLTEPWPGMEYDFKAGEDFEVFENIEELKEKIAYYLAHFDEARAIAEHGYQTVQKFSRINWTKSIMNLADKFPL